MDNVIYSCVRFESKFEPDSNGCWIWVGAKDRLGYGTFKHNDKTVSAHRFSWELYEGKIPDGMCVLHRCDVRECVNPDHLFLGTQLDNIRDRDTKGRGADTVGIKNGRAKITPSVVRAIRACPSWSDAVGVGVEHGLAVGSVGDVWHRRSWRHVDA